MEMLLVCVLIFVSFWIHNLSLIWDLFVWFICCINATFSLKHTKISNSKFLLQCTVWGYTNEVDYSVSSHSDSCDRGRNSEEQWICCWKEWDLGPSLSCRLCLLCIIMAHMIHIFSALNLPFCVLTYIEIRTSTVEINDESRGRPFQKAKVREDYTLNSVLTNESCSLCFWILSFYL